MTEQITSGDHKGNFAVKQEIIETECLCSICKVATVEELRSYRSDPNAPWEFLAHPSCAYQLGLVEWE